MGAFPWKPEEMTWVHHAFMLACEMRIAEKQGNRSTGIVTTITGSSLFDEIENTIAQR